MYTKTIVSEQNDLMKLSDAFEYFDKHNDGVISFEEVCLNRNCERQFRDALQTLRLHETFKDHSDYSITTDETKLRQLFNDIDFGENGTF